MNEMNLHTLIKPENFTFSLSWSVATSVLDHDFIPPKT